ncbi:MAG: DUF1934 domain-containing protein [Lachnospiraceae bacterium]|nr:DUF1934 domain-containing protein [Lachnospiraceae bacterium]
MTKEVSIKIKGKQSYPEGEVVETVTESVGDYYLRNGAHYIMFEEKEAGFTQSTKSMLKVRGGLVELTKKGLVQSNMVFEEGRLHTSEYRTPFGVVPMGVKTKQVRIQEGEHTLKVQIVYELLANEERMADCDICIQVKSKA